MALTVTITPAHVREIIQTNYSDDEIEGLLATASALYKSRLMPYTFDAEVQVELLRWLTAHFIAVRGSQPVISSNDTTAGSSSSGGTVIEERIGDASVKYSSIGKSYYSSSSSSMYNLRTTFFGQQAIALDHTGTLGSLGGKMSRMVAL